MTIDASTGEQQAEYPELVAELNRILHWLAEQLRAQGENTDPRLERARTRLQQCVRELQGE